ncbi:MAG: hypothetical protein ACRYHA_07045 [Janthinobacterium lividum]
MTASSKDSQALEHAATGAGLSGDENDARSPNPAPAAQGSSAPAVPPAQTSTDTSTNAGASAPDDFPDASKPGTEPASEAGKSDKPKVPVPAQDATGELPSPNAVGEAG